MSGKSRVFFALHIGNACAGFLTIELFDKEVPRTVERFISLTECVSAASAGSNFLNTYIGSKVVSVEKGKRVILGNYSTNLRSSEFTRECPPMPDESYLHRHAAPGIVSLYNLERNMNNFTFQITLGKMPEYDGMYVAFGKVISGLQVLYTIESLPLNNSNIPRVPVYVSSCGLVTKNVMSKIQEFERVAQLYIDQDKGIIETLIARPSYSTLASETEALIFSGVQIRTNPLEGTRLDLGQLGKLHEKGSSLI